jgi:hypothetical protein
MQEIRRLEKENKEQNIKGDKEEMNEMTRQEKLHFKTHKNRSTLGKLNDLMTLYKYDATLAPEKQQILDAKFVKMS